MQQPHFRLIVGLGNPGRAYAETRHNVGFMILDKLAARDGFDFRHEKKWGAGLGTDGAVHFCKPLNYMNRSGEPVSAVAGFYKIPASEILVVLDDAALPLGKLRIRSGGTSGGHNGMQSIIDHCGTQSIARLRVGIGSATQREMIDHVLGRFPSDERAALSESLDRAVEAIDFAQKNGLQAAMNQFN